MRFPFTSRNDPERLAAHMTPGSIIVIIKKYSAPLKQLKILNIHPPESFLA